MQGHISVLLHESIDGLNLSPGKVFVDATVGNAGHSLEIYGRFGNTVRIIALDADPQRAEFAGNVLKNAGADAEIFNKNFRNIDSVFAETDTRPDAVLFDLGLNSEQLAQSGRGFTFQKDEPLLMTFGEGQITAMDIVNGADETELADILYRFGEETQARNISRSIVEARRRSKIKTTFQLIEAVRKGYRGKYPKKIHFATKTFQALRIAVNDEIGALNEGLRKSFNVLSPGGRIAVISFHSLEDREVKKYFKSLSEDKKGSLFTKKPIRPGQDEIKSNPRSRSAKLRIIEKSK